MAKYAIYVIHNGEQIGPFTKSCIMEMLANREITLDHSAWHDKISDWLPLKDAIPDLVEWKRQREESARWEEGSKQREEKEKQEAARRDDFYKQQEIEKTLYPSYFLRADIAAAEKELEDAKRDDDRDYIQDMKDALKRVKTARVDFWRATMHKYGVCCNIDDDIIEHADLIDRFTADYGRFFKPQSAKRISDILDALDSASADWDKTEPHSFYVTLRDNFPNSLKTKTESIPRSHKPAPIHTNKHAVEWTQVVTVALILLVIVLVLLAGR